MVIWIAVFATLMLMTGLAVYSALRLAKKTDEIVTCFDDEDQRDPLVVSFPQSVFSKSEQPGVAVPKG